MFLRNGSFQANITGGLAVIPIAVYFVNVVGIVKECARFSAGANWNELDALRTV